MSGKQLAAITGGGILIILALVGWGVLVSRQPDVIALARRRFDRAVAEKRDLSSGPCLGKIADDWVLDIAHLPRQEVDDLPQNQCPDFAAGKAHHFVEMTREGEVIRAQ